MPKIDYRNQAGDKVVSVTQAIGNLGWKSYGLMLWAYGLGKEGKDLEKTRGDLADAGSLCHAMASADITGRPAPKVDLPEEVAKKAADSFGAYLDWKRSTRLELRASEVAMVSEEHRYGGCLDAIAVFGGAAGLLDFKSSKALYPDQIVQLAAYWKLWEENNPDLPLSHWHVLRWAPDGGFTHHSISRQAMEAGWEAFLCCLRLHTLKKAIKP